MLIRGAQRAVAVLLQLNERRLGDGRRIVAAVVRRWWAEMAAAAAVGRHRWRAGRLLGGAPKWGAQIREVERRERFDIHLGGKRVRWRRRLQVRMRVQTAAAAPAALLPEVPSVLRGSCR